MRALLGALCVALSLAANAEDGAVLRFERADSPGLWAWGFPEDEKSYNFV